MDLVVEALQADYPGVQFNVEHLALNEKEWHETNTDGSTTQRDVLATARAAKNGLWVAPGKKFYSSRPTKGPLAHLALKRHDTKTKLPESVVQMAWINVFRKLYASPLLAKQIQMQIAATSNVALPRLNRKRPDFCAISEDGRHSVRIKSTIAFSEPIGILINAAFASYSLTYCHWHDASTHSYLVFHIVAILY